MSKNIKIIIIAALTVLILAAALIVILLLPKEDNSTTNTPSAINLINRNYLDVEEIKVENSHGSYELVGYLTETYYNYDTTSSDSSSESENANSYETMIYTMQEHPKNHLSQYQTQQLAYHCANITASKIVDKTGERYAEFGLSKPRATVTITFNDNTKKTLYIGNDAVGKENTVYIRFEGDKYVYLVALDTVSMFLEDGLQLFDKSLSISLERDSYIESMVINGTYLEKPIKIDATDNTNSDSAYLMYSPYREICNADTMENFCETYLFGLEGDSVAAVDCSDEELKKYGLAEPYSDIFVTATCGSIHLLTSAPDKDKNCYIMAAGENIIYKISADKLPWLDISYKDFLSDSIFAPNFLSMNNMKISTGKTDYDFDITHETKENIDGKPSTVHTVMYGNTEINYQYFENYIHNLCEITRTDESVENAVRDDLLLSVQFAFENDITDTIELYVSGTKCLVVLNGHAESYTDLTYANDLVSYVSLLAQNKEVPKRNMALETSDGENSTDVSKAESSAA
ncbi:MAG: DUF4340 domain-containing protein [Acutalibacteraceae bacterium]